MVLVADPVGTGLIESLARPGGNITGTSLMQTETSAKRLQLLKELVPRARSVAVLWNPSNSATARQWKETREASGSLGLKALSVEMRTRDEVVTAFAAIVRERPDGLVVLLDSLMGDLRHEIVDFAAKNRLPAIYAGTPFAEAGGLLVYSVDFYELGVAPPSTWTGFYGAPNQPTCPSSSRRSSISSSTSRPPRPSASRSRPRCWRGRIK
jgi:putative ABC transport system substrate-binding protein